MGPYTCLNINIVGVFFSAEKLPFQCTRLYMAYRRLCDTQMTASPASSVNSSMGSLQLRGLPGLVHQFCVPSVMIPGAKLWLSAWGITMEGRKSNSVCCAADGVSLLEVGDCTESAGSAAARVRGKTTRLSGNCVMAHTYFTT